MSRTTTIRDLPTEIILLIWLRRSCWAIRKSIPSPTHAKLIEAETDDFGRQNNLYACRDCLRLRPRAKFGDKMIKKEKSKWGRDARDRWCVDCGIDPRPGTNRYTAGNHIEIFGEHNVICLRCRKFQAGALENGIPLSVCQVCQRNAKTIEERKEADRARQERDRLRAVQAERRARGRAIYGSDSESDEIIPPSPSLSQGA
ncbi:hypothetical protein N7471_013433 [Penicillium samsonianum]|uniref:uncharacterized protein n=1 Tax=Penicillium samsonianum TaxID=1882272 RepID=UPI002548A1CF|nr:uncharacterized protein N7471_013433 [Penicillium samsonianum]KAJ6118813.1 hypothetical protein N7471_013433 [Penicillium samsonianum]